MHFPDTAYRMCRLRARDRGWLSPFSTRRCYASFTDLTVAGAVQTSRKMRAKTSQPMPKGPDVLTPKRLLDKRGLASPKPRMPLDP
jgi:hypothetical protein